MRETLKVALAAGLVTGEEHDSLLELAINTYYPDRSYLGLVKEGVKKSLIPEEKRELLLDFCKNEEVDVKRKDAILVLETVKKMLEEA